MVKQIEDNENIFNRIKGIDFRKLNKEKDYLDLIANVKKELEKGENKIEIYNNLGFLYEKLGELKIKEKNIPDGIKNYLISIDNLKKTLKEKPGNKYAYQGLGISYNELGRIYLNIGEDKKGNESFLNSKKNLEILLFLDSKNIDIYNSLGNVLKNLGNTTIFDIKNKEGKKNYLLSIEKFEEALKKDSESIFAYNELGNAYAVLGKRSIIEGDEVTGEKNYLCSIKNLNEVVKRNSCDDYTYNNLGFSYGELAKINIKNKSYDFGEENCIYSIENFQKALDKGSKTVTAYNNISLAYVMLGEIYLNGFKTKENKEIKENYLKSIDNSKKALGLSCENIFAYNNLGLAYKMLGRISFKNRENETAEKNYLCSIKNYEKTIFLNESSKEPLFYLGNSLIEYLRIPYNKEKTLIYLENKDSVNDDNQPIEKFIKKKCYFITNNLEKIEFLDEKIKNYLKTEISKEFRKEFKIKVNRFKLEETEYKKTYYMYKSINNNLLVSLNEKKLRKGNPYLFNDPFDPYYKMSHDLIENDLKRIRISCFAEDKDNLLMWAHYGDEHKGICIEYDYNILKEKLDEFTCFEKVIYEEIKTHKEIEKNDDLLIEKIKIDEELLTINEMCLRKHKDWHYENEWRMISLEEEDRNDLYYKNINISKIFFGMKCSESNKKLIMQLLKNRTEIKYYEMNQDINLTLKEKEIKLGTNGEIEREK